MGVLPYPMFVWCPQRLEEGVDDCELPVLLVLGMEPRSSGRATSAPNGWAISLEVWDLVLCVLVSSLGHIRDVCASYTCCHPFSLDLLTFLAVISLIAFYSLSLSLWLLLCKNESFDYSRLSSFQSVWGCPGSPSVWAPVESLAAGLFFFGICLYFYCFYFFVKFLTLFISYFLNLFHFNILILHRTSLRGLCVTFICSFLLPVSLGFIIGILLIFQFFAVLCHCITNV